MTDTHQFDPSILKEYDIRGILGKTLSEADAYAVGRNFGTAVVREGGRKVSLGWDGRPSSPGFADAAARGMADCGLEVLRIGLGPTPMLYYSVFAHGTDGGLMITASHNPPEYNGFKMMIGTRSFFGADIQALGQRAAAGDVESGTGSVRDLAVFDEYIERMLKDYDGTRELHVAWDPGNGAAGDATVALTRRLPGRHTVINAEIDGTFPNHHPDPTVPKNLVQLQETVAREGCDMGFSFDGDGDRIGVIDGRGRILWGDQLMVLLSQDLLSHTPGATIIADVKASQTLFDAVAAAGGNPVMWKTGHSLIKSKMKETGAPLAGEMSGHLFFADKYYGFDDALYAAVRVLSMVSRSGQSLDEMFDRVPRVFNTPEMRIPVDAARKLPVVEEVKARAAASGAEISDIDGVRALTEDGWWLLRASNTQEVLVGRCESRTEEGLARLKEGLRQQLDQSGVAMPEL